MKSTITALLALSILAGCDASAEKAQTEQAENSADHQPCTSGLSQWEGVFPVLVARAGQADDRLGIQAKRETLSP